jgi:hypothetical protein
VRIRSISQHALPPLLLSLKHRYLPGSPGRLQPLVVVLVQAHTNLLLPQLYRSAQHAAQQGLHATGTKRS